MSQPIREPVQNVTILLALDMNDATVAWWALIEKENQLKTRINQYTHTSWPAEAISAAQWEYERIKSVRERLEKLGAEINEQNTQK